MPTFALSLSSSTQDPAGSPPVHNTCSKTVSNRRRIPRPKPILGHVQCICQPKSFSNRLPKRDTHFGYRARQDAKMPTSRSSPPARRKAAVLLDPRGPPLLQLQAGRRMELAAASRAAAPKSSRSRPPALQQRKEEPGAAARGSGSSATASSATARRRRAPFLPFFATTCPLPSHPPAPAPVPPRRRRRVVPERGPAAAPPPPSPLLPPPPPWAGGGDASWLGWRRHGGSGPPRGKLERAVGGWRRTEASSPRPPGPSSPMAPGRAPHGGENFAFAVGDAEILVWNPFTVHDLKHGMGLVFGSSLLEIALEQG